MRTNPHDIAMTRLERAQITAVPVAGIARSAAGRITVLVAETIGDLDIQGAFEHGLGHLCQQPVGPVDGCPGCSASANRASTAAGGNSSANLRTATASSVDESDCGNWNLLSGGQPNCHHQSDQTPYTVNETRPRHEPRLDLPVLGGNGFRRPALGFAAFGSNPSNHRPAAHRSADKHRRRDPARTRGP